MQFIDLNPNPRRRARMILFGVVLVSLIIGIVSAYEDGQLDWRGLAGNLSTELIGGVVTFVLIDLFILRNEDQSAYKKTLISQLENHDSGIVKRVIQELRANGWLTDGSLYGWFLQKANFEGIWLKDMNTNGLGLFRCNLKDARITEAQLVQMNDLRFTIMSDGSLYDGRYCLPGDVDWAKTKYGIDFMEASAAQMADYYGVPQEAFLEGQRWAVDNLPRLGVDVPGYIHHLFEND